MTLADDAVIFALTGAFGSGCTTLASALADDPGFITVKVSDYIRASWTAESQPENELPLQAPPRGTLQDVGDRHRRDDRAYWIKHILEQLARDRRDIRQLVIDGIRNPAEIEWLRGKYVNAYLIAVDTHPEKRWKRLLRAPEWSNRSYEEFLAVSARDQEAPEDWGQRVQQCVDLADFVINNDEECQGVPAAKEALRRKATDFLQLCSGTARRRPDPDELYMHLAYSASAGSACLKRNVGAIIVRPGEKRSVYDDHNKVRQIVRQGVGISTGYNENPDWMSPCFVEYSACFRDIWRKEQFEAKQYRLCPYCGADITNLSWPFKCPNQDCGHRSLLETLFPERAMTKCTAIHAEARALRVAGDRDLSDCYMYSTTCPCFLCSEQILQSGIARVVYVESYPDLESENLLVSHGVVVDRFSGVKSLAFGKIFGDWRADAERKYRLSS